MNKENVMTKTELESAKEDVIDAEEIKTELKRLEQIMIRTEERFSGPLPHPEHFKKYNQIVPGSANRLLKMAEDDLNHIHSMQKSQMIIEAIATIGGLIIGGAIAIVSLVGSGYLILQGHDAAGALLGTGALTSLVGIFVYGRRSQKDTNNK